MIEEQKAGIFAAINSWLIEHEGFMSLIALSLSLIAIGISLYIANRQNKIELFEKRYKVYEKYVELKVVREGMNITKLPPGIEDNSLNWRIWYINIILSKGSFGKVPSTIPMEVNLIEQAKEDVAALEQINYFFPLKKDDKNAISKLVTCYENIITALLNNDSSIKEINENFVKVFDESFPRIIKIIEKNLIYK